MRELRFTRGLEVRQQNGKPMIRGIAAPFNSLSHDLGGFVEKIAPGAFTKAIANDDVRALVDHDPSKIIGRTKNGTLTLREGPTGLYCEISPPDTSVGRDVVENIKNGNLDGMSFGFGAVDENWGSTDDGQPLRELREIKLYDVSVVTYPAYPATSVSMRSLLFPDGVPKAVKQHEKSMNIEPRRKPSDNPYAWMSPSMQRFYQHQDRRQKTYKALEENENFLTANPNSIAARKLRLERELAIMKSDLDQLEAWEMKKELDRKNAAKDPWASYRLF